MAILPFPFGAITPALALFLMHGISVTMFRSFLNQTLPTMQASSTGDKYQITLSKPTAKISNFIPEEIKFIQQQLNNRNKNLMQSTNQSLQMNQQQLSTSSTNQQTSIPSIPQQILNPIASSSNIIQQISQIRQQPFSGSISLHNNNQASRSLSDISNQLINNQLLNKHLPLNDNQILNSQSKHISSLNLPFISAGLNPLMNPTISPTITSLNQQPKIIHVHHHELEQPSLSSNPIEQSPYQNLNLFESKIQPGSMISFTALSKRNGLIQNEPVVKELPLNKISKYLENKKKSEIKKSKENTFRVVCTYVFDEFAKEILDPKLMDDASFCTHLNINSLIIKSDNYQATFQNYYQDTLRLNELIKIKDVNKNLKFILSIGNDGDIQIYDNLCSNTLFINQFIDSIIDLINLYDLDGINFNLKFDKIQPDINLSFLFKQNLVQLLKLFRSELNRIGKYNFIISALLPNSPDTLKSYFDLDALNSILDFVNVIGYEFHDYKKENPIAKHHSSLYSSKKDDNLEWLVKNWLDTPLDKSKINIGLSTFGRTYNAAFNNLKTLNAPLIGLGINNGTINYGDVCKFLIKNDTRYIYNEKHQVPYAYNGYDLILFENEKSLSLKSKYINKHNIHGIMLYALNYDDTKSDCTIIDKLDNEFNRFPLHKVAFKTMQFASFVNLNYRKKFDKRK